MKKLTLFTIFAAIAAQSGISDEPCRHEWIRDPERLDVVYCSMPPKYDYICKLCGDRKVDFAPELSEVDWHGEDMMSLTPEDLRLIKTAEGVP